MDGTGFEAAIFDVDGVLVNSPHERAWGEALQSLMDADWRAIRDETGYAPERFTADLYHAEMSGRPTMEGARAALEHFGVPDVEERIQAYGERKQQTVDAILADEGVEAYPDALRFILAVRAAGVRLAAASSSKNAGRLLGGIRLDRAAQEMGLSYDFVAPGLTLLELFDADVSGRDFDRGKPHPEIFYAAAEELGVAAGGCFVVEDAVSGVLAAKAGEMAALGVARAVEAEALADARADLVVASLDEVDLEALAEGRLAAGS